MDCINGISNIEQSKEYCLRLIQRLEDNCKIPENKFVGETALALEIAHQKQIEKLKKIYEILIRL